jgi:hypothetical protein
MVGGSSYQYIITDSDAKWIAGERRLGRNLGAGNGSSVTTLSANDGALIGMVLDGIMSGSQTSKASQPNSLFFPTRPRPLPRPPAVPKAKPKQQLNSGKVWHQGSE